MVVDMAAGGDLIHEARRRAHLTQRELADRAGTTQSAVARWESGSVDPRFGTVRRLLRACEFNLLVALDPYDGSDLAQAESLLAMTPEARFDTMVAATTFLASIRGTAGIGIPDAG